ncbi:MAG: hypothetical protein ACRYG7_08830 [Janthinobacterium lividum]
MLDAPIQPVDATATVSTGSATVVLRTIDGSNYTAVATGRLFKTSDIGNDSPIPVKTIDFEVLPGSNPPLNKITATFTGLVPTDYVLKVTSTDSRTLTPDPRFTIGQPAPAACDLKAEIVSATAAEVNPTPPALGTATGKVKIKVTGTGTNGGYVSVKLSQGDLDMGSELHEKNVTLDSTGSAIVEFTGLVAGIYLLTAKIGNCLYPKQGDLHYPTHEVQIPIPPLEIGDQLTFLPWVQSELARNADLGENGRPELTIKAELRTTDSTRKPATTLDEKPGSGNKAQIYGPGDVLGINLRAILGTTPVPEATGFSPLQLAAIEFKEEDLPWRFSTRKVSGAPVPWCFLLVLKQEEFSRLPQNGQPLPSIQILNTAAYPSADAQQQAMWGHVQINASLGGPKPTPTGTKLAPPDADDIQKFLAETLPQSPDLAYSRLVSPRRLEANTAYHGFLLPAIEAGRLAGLSQSYTKTDAQDASYPSKTILADTFPVYFEWSFATGVEEDFESLAGQLHQANETTQAAVAPLLGGELEGQVLALPMPGVLLDADGEDPDATPVPYEVAHTLWNALSPAFQAGAPVQPRPLVAPPLYGRAYMVSTQLAEPSVRQPVAPSWKHTVNLDPRYRAVAAAGAQVVRDNQEEYVRRAWDQVQDILLANEKLRATQYGLRTTAGLRDQHLPLLTATTITTTTTTPVTGVAGDQRLRYMAPPDSTGAVEPAGDAVTTDASAQALTVEGAIDEPTTTDEFTIMAADGPVATTTVKAGTTLADYGLQLTALSLSRTRAKKTTSGTTTSADGTNSGLTLRETIRRSTTPLAAFSPTFRRINKPFGKYQIGQAGRPLRPTQAEPTLAAAGTASALTQTGTSLRQRDGLLHHLAAGNLAAAPDRTEQVRAYQFNDKIVDHLLFNNVALAPSANSPLAKDPQAVERFKTAFTALVRDTPQPKDGQAVVLGFRKPQFVRPNLDLEDLKQDVITATQPAPYFAERVKQIAPDAPIPTLPSRGDFEYPDFNANHFYVGDFNEPGTGDWLSDDFLATDFLVDTQVAVNDDPAPMAPRRQMLAQTAMASLTIEGASSTIEGDERVQSLESVESNTTTTTTTTNVITGTAPTLHTDADLPVIKQVKAFPVFKEAMGEPLRQRYPELFVPGLGDFPASGVAVLEVNQAFIEAYMVGLNHALGSELHWRGFPIDMRGTFFQQFWDVSEHLNAQTDPIEKPSLKLESALLDITPIDQWVGNPLGSNALEPDPQAGFAKEPLRLALRSELLRRYPTLVIGLQPSQLDDAGQPVPDPDPEHLMLPRQRLPVGQDLAIVTFDVALIDAAAAPGEGGGYYLVLLERPGQPTFGLDAGTNAVTEVAPTGWDQLSWDYKPVHVAPGASLTFDFSDQLKHLPHATAEPDKMNYISDSAMLAYALFQEPILVALPVQELLS